MRSILGRKNWTKRIFTVTDIAKDCSHEMSWKNAIYFWQRRQFVIYRISQRLKLTWLTVPFRLKWILLYVICRLNYKKIRMWVKILMQLLNNKIFENCTSHNIVSVCTFSSFLLLDVYHDNTAKNFDDDSFLQVVLLKYIVLF